MSYIRHILAIVLIVLIPGIPFSFSQGTVVKPLEKKKTTTPAQKEAQRLFVEGNGYLKRGEYLQAMAFYRQALQSDTTAEKALDSLALCYRVTGKPDSAEYCYRRLILLNPKNLPAMTRLAMVYMMKDDLVKAEQTYVAILKIDPKDPDGYFGLAEIMLKTARYQPATENALKAYDLWKTTNKLYAGDALYYAGLGYLMLGDTAKAKNYFTRAIKLGVKIPEDHLQRAGITPNTP